MQTSHYQQAKQQLKELQREVRKTLHDDIPAQQFELNNLADMLSRDFKHHYSEKQAEQRANQLHSFCADLHP